MSDLPPPDAVRHVTDARDLRALSHPLRLRILGLLRMDGPATATSLSEALDEAPSLLSYHLRTLAERGFVVEAPELATDGRQRWWRAAHSFTRFDSADLGDDVDARSAGERYLRAVRDRYQEAIAAWAAERGTWSEAWRHAGTASDWILHLDPEGLLSLNAELEEVIERHRHREPPAGAETVRVILHDFPQRGAR